MKSNCIIQALKHRMLYGCPVYYIKTRTKDGLPHFVWWDNSLGSYRHYTIKGKLPWWKLILFHGYIDNFPSRDLLFTMVRII